ncbi:hypothetical protein A2U01_0056147, partial [Trifolium medium]|nr:hypothetical protein [Trifolium medium]
MRQIRSHYTRADGSLNERGFYTKLFGFSIGSSDSESSEESNSDSSSDCYIIPLLSLTGKDLVMFNPAVFDDLPSEMDTSSKFSSVESIQCFREVNKLYNGEEEDQIIVEPVGEKELVTT